MWGEYSSEDEGDVEEDEPERRSSFDAASSSKTALVSQDAFDALRSATVAASSPSNQNLPEMEELPPPPPVEGPKPVLQVGITFICSQLRLLLLLLLFSRTSQPQSNIVVSSDNGNDLIVTGLCERRGHKIACKRKKITPE